MSAKERRIQLVGRVIMILPRAERLINSPDRELAVCHEGQLGPALRLAISLVLDNGADEAAKIARKRLQEAKQLCDVCGKYSANITDGDQLKCAVCWLCGD